RRTPRRSPLPYPTRRSSYLCSHTGHTPPITGTGPPPPVPVPMSRGCHVGRRGRPVDASTRARVLDLHAAGRSRNAIARELNLSGDRKSTRLNSSHVRTSYAV